MAEELPLPIEIPWRLAATTQPLAAGGPDETTISLFTFQPDDAALSGEWPDASLVFLKVTATISSAAPPLSMEAGPALAPGERLPCYHVQLDMSVRRGSGELGTIVPYFHAAAPLRREMLQTGIVGAAQFEGESTHQLVGKSGSQMYETSASRGFTDTVTGGVAILGVGLSTTSTTTAASGQRSVTQVSDTTTREASRERRELVSHMTNVENVLSLLNAKYVGTPYLRFSMWPRPLEQLSADSSDPSLWLSQLIQRRSSGLEGVQDFTMVVVVPKGEDFCVTASLRRVCLFDVPPVEPNFNQPPVGTDHFRIWNYVDENFPIGTPLEELDINITGDLTTEEDPPGPPKEPFSRPVIETWLIGGTTMSVRAVASASPGFVAHAWANYKTYPELWLETQRSEYERDLARSPLERGVPLGESRLLDTCFAFGPDGALAATKSISSVNPLRPLRIGPRDLGPAGPVAGAGSARKSVKARALETVVRWNALDRKLAALLDTMPKEALDKPGRLNDPRLVQVLLDRWARLSVDDPRNLGLPKAIEALGLTAKRRIKLKAAGVTDLRSLARALNAAPVVERYHEGLARHRQAAAASALAGIGEPIAFPIGRKDAGAIILEIANGLFAAADAA